MLTTGHALYAAEDLQSNVCSPVATGSASEITAPTIMFQYVDSPLWFTEGRLYW